MNGWVRKEGKQNEAYRVTASGARHLLVIGSAAATIQTSADGINWVPVATQAAVAGVPADFGTTHSVDFANQLLGSFFRVTNLATFYYFQED